MVRILLVFIVGLVFLFARSPDTAIVQKKTLANDHIVTISPHYVEYSEAALAKAHETGKVVLFFWAPWCGTCSQLDEELRRESATLPNTITILKVNFDTQKQLREKYYVTLQHTLVEVDRNNNEVNKWIGPDLELLRQELQDG